MSTETAEVKSVKIKKAKIISGLFLDVEWTEELPGHSKNEVGLKCTVPIHEDLKGRFQLLHKHLAVLCDFYKAPKPVNFADTEYTEFVIKGFTIAGIDESLAVTISGTMDGKYGSVNLNTPLTKYGTSEYPFTSELATDIEGCIYEVEQYLFHGKRAPEKQLDLPFDEDTANASPETIHQD